MAVDNSNGHPDSAWRLKSSWFLSGSAEYGNKTIRVFACVGEPPSLMLRQFDLEGFRYL
jgi:hypothetical protein